MDKRPGECAPLTGGETPPDQATTEWYAAPNAVAPFTGTINHPFLLEHALIFPWLRPGNTLYLRGGTYYGDYTATVDGTAEAPIIIKPYNNERAIIDGSLIINGDYNEWHDLEKRLTGGTRQTDEEGIPSGWADGTLAVYGVGTKLINPVIYDQVDNGLGWWSDAGGGLVYGAVIFNNGWLGPDRGHGHGIYTQNIEASAARKVIKHCILAQGFAPSSGAGATNLAVYGSADGSPLRKFDVQETAMMDGQQLMSSIGDSTMTGCHIFGANLQLGYFNDQDSIGVTVTENRINGKYCLLYLQSATSTGNTVIVDNNDVVLAAEPGQDFLGYISSGNAYHCVNGPAEPFRVDAVGTFTFDGWKARYGCDADSTYQTTLPADSTHVYANEYKATRGLIVVWNWSEAASVIVDVSSITGIAAGNGYTLRSAIDYFGDVGTGTVAVDGTITIDMRAISHSVSIPDGWEVPLMDTTFPRFGTFQIDKVDPV